MSVFWRIIVWSYLVVFQAVISNAQCISNDSVRKEIAIIKNDQSDYYLKISKLTALQDSYLKCHQKIEAVYAEIMHRLGDCYAQAGNLEQGISFTDNAIDVNKHTGKREPFLCNSYYNLGVFYLQLNMIHQSNDCFINCIAAGKSFPEKNSIVGKAHFQLAYSFFKAGDYQQARNSALRGMFFSDAAKDTVEEGALRAQQAQADIELGDFENAGKSIATSLFLLDGKNNIQLASTYSIYANYLNVTGNHKASLNYYQNAFLLNSKLQKFRQCVNDLIDFGNVYHNGLKQENDARKCYSLGLQFAIKNKDSYQIAALYENIGVTYWSQHDFKKALIFYQQALNVLPIGFTDKSVKSNPEIGTLNQISNDYYVSTLLANKAESLLALYKETTDKSLLQAALQTFLLASRSVDMMRWKQSGELSKLHWRTETKEMYENAIEVCYLLNDAENGFYFFEKSRSVLLSDQLNSSLKTSAIRDVKPGKKMQAKMDSLDKKLVSAGNDENIDNLKKEWLAVHQEWEDEQNRLNAKIYEGDDQPGKLPESIRLLQHTLSSNKQSLVEYFNNDSVVYALLITPVKAQIYKIPYASYRNDCSEFLKYCSNATLLNQHYDHYANLAGKLYQKLFKPLQIDNQRVIISPGDNFIPFDALLDDPRSDNSFLIKKYSFSYVYSMQVLANQHKGNTPQKTIFLGIAPENYNASFHLEPLTGSVGSLRRIQSSFGSYNLLNGENAKKSELLSQLPQSQIVQIYSHASADSTTRDPVLYMADSAVSMSEIQKLKCSNTDLVVLSACNTGIGYNAVGEGLFSLARGFRLAGIPSTVTNLWQADNKATYQLTESFYKYLSLGLPKDVSLRKAKLDFLKSDQSHLLPYYWAPVIVLGDSSPLNTHLSLNQTNWPLISLVVLITLTACLLFFVHKRGNTR
jgi:CHAT domain-containing protein/tetratricopeptide (TPR) repeat protein